MPSPEPSPRPWRVEESIGGWKACVSDADGKPVASCWGGGPTEQQEKAEANARLIVDAVNERDRLRDLVRRLSRHLANYITSESENDLLREASAAIVEDAP